MNQSWLVGKNNHTFVKQKSSRYKSKTKWIYPKGLRITMTFNTAYKIRQYFNLLHESESHQFKYKFVNVQIIK